MGWFSKKDDGFFLATVVPDTDAARVAAPPTISA